MSPVLNDGKVEIYVVNDSASGFKGNLHVKITDFHGNNSLTDNIIISVGANSSGIVHSISEEDIRKEDTNELLLSVKVYEANTMISDNILYFDYWDSLNFPEPDIRHDIEKEGDCFIIRLSSSVLSKNLFLEVSDHDGYFSDNYFDIIPGEKCTIKYSPENDLSIEKFRKYLKITTLTDAAI